ncbi:putative hydrophobic protein (TIGR00271 family) [Thermocatellispora tengchongensis]|uniref:Putative hydrophobic protein (TIGR00271 family) n=2 Tax=Thermocatellispora tengchongensis TaxID=1073253 RepID=A0A840PKD8_9ACTN|nr:putative hydrophobic protein (TIGR00271 family) [Thermocatellispora tengchongensis]
MLHMRVISPRDRTEDAVGYLTAATGVTNLVVLAGAARDPQGDLILFDVAREAANHVIDHLKELRVHEDGSIAGEHVDLSLSHAAERAEEEAPGDSDDAVIWEELAQRVADDCKVTWAFLAFMAIAVQIAAIGVVVNSPILIVGAMVLGPEFGAIAAICFGLLTGHPPVILRALRTLAVGFAAAIAITLVCALVSRPLGWLDAGMLNTGHEEVQFIVKPDRWSFIVALLAGIAGVLSITAGKSSSLVGVFISVTTVPAAGYAALGIALGQWSEVGGSVAQLAVNIAGMIIAGTLTLYAQRFLWARFGRRAPAALRRTLTAPPGSPRGAGRLHGRMDEP